MKLLLTSAGISNASIHHALVDLLGKPIAEASALFIPTAIYAFPGGDPFPYGSEIAARMIRGTLGDPFCDLGWRSLGVLELTALPSLKRERWVPLLQQTDVLLVGGGDCQYLTFWMQRSGLADLLPSLLDRLVYVGLSAGSMILTRFGTTYGGHALPAETDKSLGLVDIALHPHLDHEWFPENSSASLETLAATLSVPSYALDDQSALKVVDDRIDVISEGHWKLYDASPSSGGAVLRAWALLSRMSGRDATLVANRAAAAFSCRQDRFSTDPSASRYP